MSILHCHIIVHHCSFVFKGEATFYLFDHCHVLIQWSGSFLHTNLSKYHHAPGVGVQVNDENCSGFLEKCQNMAEQQIMPWCNGPQGIAFLGFVQLKKREFSEMNGGWSVAE
jgi:hypothetical protein